MKGLVSVVFPIGPGVPGAGRALADLLDQSWQSLEIIAVLNGCLPAVRAEFLACRDERLRVIDLGGEPQLMTALDTAVDESRGEWLARMDSDDRCASLRIGEQVRLLMGGSCEVVSCGISLVGALGGGMQRYVDWVNGLDCPELVSRERFIESPVIQPSVMMSKQLFLEAGGYLRNGFAEDYDLWLRLLERGARFGKVPGMLYQWHDREARLTRSDPRFGQKKMLELKADALSRLDRVRKMGVVISGAGPIGKSLAKALLKRGVTLHGFFDVSPGRVGGICRGVPVAGLDEFGTRWREAVLLSAVGVVGGREKVREIAKSQGYGEGDDFWCCC